MAVQQALGAGVTLAGDLISSLAGAKAARKQNKALAEGLRQQDRSGMEASSEVGAFLDQLRRSSVDPSMERGAFVGALQSPGVSVLPTASRAFRASAAGAGNAAQAYGARLADLFSRIRAPSLQRQQEAVLAMQLGDRLRPIQMRSQDDQFLTGLRAGMIQPDPWAQLLGGFASNAGQYMMGQGGR